MFLKIDYVALETICLDLPVVKQSNVCVHVHNYACICAHICVCVSTCAHVCIHKASQGLSHTAACVYQDS